MTNTPQTHTFVSRPIQTKKNGVICKFVSLTQHYSSQWIERDGSRDSTQLGSKSPALLVEPLLEHQTMNKAQQLHEPKGNSYLCNKTNKSTCMKYVTVQKYKENKRPNYVSGTTQL
jgi:hypothetical protein